MYKRIYFVVLVLSIVPLLIVLSFYYRMMSDNFITTTSRDLERESINLSYQVRQFLISSSSDLDIMSKINYFYIAVEYNTYENIKDFFNKIILSNKQYSNIYFLDNNENLKTYNTMHNDGAEYDSYFLYSSIKPTLSLNVSEYQTINTPNGPVLVVVKKILNRDNNKIGFLVSVINKDYISKMYERTISGEKDLRYGLFAENGIKILGSLDYLYEKQDGEEKRFDVCEEIILDGSNSPLKSCLQINDRYTYSKYLETKRYFVLVTISSLVIVTLTSLFLLYLCLKPFQLILSKLGEISADKYCLFEIKKRNPFNKYFRSVNLIIEKMSSNKSEKEKLSQLAIMGRVAQFMAHDIRRPFSQIKLMLSTLESFMSDSNKLEKAKKEIDLSIKNVEGMLSDIIESNKSSILEIKASYLSDVIDKAFKQCSIEVNNINLITEINSEQVLLCDEDKLVRCITNILENAVEAINSGELDKHGEIVISSDSVLVNSKRFVEIKISNNGPLILKEDINKVFDSFFTKGKKKGIGLGLAFVNRIITLHGGKVGVRNKEDASGVEFCLSIPEINEVKLLLLEDDALYRQMVKELILSKSIIAIDVLEEASVGRALELTKKFNITHALVDLDLGTDESGMGYIEEIKRSKKNIHVAIHTNRVLDKSLSEFIDKNSVGYISKPMDINKFYSFIQNSGGA
ncbi:MAG TPA: ATP-binding protein [bacterium]|nr:ATP-binding protein [bacterium]